MTSDTEQWKLEGDCTKCRKDPYCTKECRPRKKVVENKMNEILYKAFSKALKKREEEEKANEESTNNNTTDNNNTDDNGM